MAEMVRFELTSPLGPPVFKNRSATSPRLRPLIVLKGNRFFLNGPLSVPGAVPTNILD